MKEANEESNIQYKYLTVSNISEIGEGSRVCLDFVDILRPDEGCYIGNNGNGYIFILSENRATQKYPPRPFRINLGGVHQYIYMGNDKTNYLADMKPGINIPIYYEKYSRDVSVGRVKIEKRNFCRVQCVEENISATLQLADSVFLYDEEKGPISIFELKPGCKIRCVSDSPGRHLGNKIEEDIIEL